MALPTPLRKLRLMLPVPMTLEEVSAWLRSRGLRCTAGHLSAVERGLKPPGPKLLAILGDFYGRTRHQMEEAVRRSGQAPRRRRA